MWWFYAGKILLFFALLAACYGMSKVLRHDELPPKYWQMADSVAKANIDAEIKAKF